MGPRRGANDHRHGRRRSSHLVQRAQFRVAQQYRLRASAGRRASYELHRLNSVDMIMSYWTGPAIAHMLISFGFDTGEHVVFSVEIRPEAHEGFSELGGFFKEFELSIIAADERDVIRVRTNIRGEDDYLYRIRMPVPRYAQPVPRLHRRGQCAGANAALLQYHDRQLHHSRLSHDEAYRRLSAHGLPHRVFRLSAASMSTASAASTIDTRSRRCARSAESPIAPKRPTAATLSPRISGKEYPISLAQDLPVKAQ